MEKLSIASIVAGYIATLFIHLLSIISFLRMVRNYLGTWVLSRKIEISVGIFIIGFEINHDFLRSPKQEVLGFEIDADSSSLISSLIEMIYQHL